MTMMDDARKPKGQQTELTHEEIAKVMGVSRAYVSLLERPPWTRLDGLWEIAMMSIPQMIFYDHLPQ